MQQRERVRRSLAHQEPDQVPVDLGAGPTSGIHVSCVAALRSHFGLSKHPVRVIEPYQMLGAVEPDLAEALGIDCVGIAPRLTLFGFANENWQSWQTPWGQEVLVPGQFQTRREASGDICIYPGGDRQAQPSARMPDDGYFFDTIIRQPQPDLDLDTADPSENFQEFSLWSEEDLDHYEREVLRCEATGRAILLTVAGCALGDIALVTAPFLKEPRGLRDISEWYMAVATNPEYIEAIFSHQVELGLKNLERLYARVGNRIDAVYLCGTDFGTQIGTFCSPQTFDALWLPYYRRITNWIHSHTSWRCFKHSCGAIAEFVPHLIEAGFDILNPVQCSARGMDPQQLKDRHGKDIVFWGAGIDTQQVLPFGSPQQVQEQVLDRCRIFSRGGGFVFNPIHNVQAATPTENILACFAAVREFNRAGG